jgi:hypothetical protein
MSILVLSLVLSVCVIFITGTKFIILCYRLCKGICGGASLRYIDIFLSFMLLIINILLMVFSIRRNEIALEILLLLANRALIIYQVSCP